MSANAPSRPPRITGPRHLVAAGSYSLGGLRRLWQETAFRHEATAAPVALLLLLWRGVPATQIAIFCGLFLLLVAVEALNTAIEVIVDAISPGWSEAARNAKDLGSLAVLCLLAVNGLFLAVALFA